MSHDNPKPEDGLINVEVNLALSGDPIQKLKQGKQAAAALMTVANPIPINGKNYLRFEDWQTIASFFGVIVGTSDPQYVDIDGLPGYKAQATVRKVADGLVISSASAYCLREGIWKDRENYALASMAQTRAGAKALRNAFSWVVSLAGYETTPFDEMPGTTTKSPEPSVPAESSEPTASVKQMDYILDLAINKYGDDAYERINEHTWYEYGKSGKEITKKEASELIEYLLHGDGELRRSK